MPNDSNFDDEFQKALEPVRQRKAEQQQALKQTEQEQREAQHRADQKASDIRGRLHRFRDGRIEPYIKRLHEVPELIGGTRVDLPERWTPEAESPNAPLGCAYDFGGDNRISVTISHDSLGQNIVLRSEAKCDGVCVHGENQHFPEDQFDDAAADEWVRKQVTACTAIALDKSSYQAPPLVRYKGSGRK